MLRSKSSAFNTVETRFFKEGDELATPPPAENDEVTAVCERRRPRGLVTWIALGATVFAACVVFAFWRASGNAEPAPAGMPAAATHVPPAASQP
jgi:hypothetical protein